MKAEFQTQNHPLLHNGLVEFLKTINKAKKLATQLEKDPEVRGYGIDFDQYDNSIGYTLDQIRFDVEKIVGYTVGDRIISDMDKVHRI